MTAPSGAKTFTSVPPAGAPVTRTGNGGWLAGMAAGLGLAWLASSFGMGDTSGVFLLVLMICVATVLVLSYRRRLQRAQGGTVLAFQGANALPVGAPLPYRPENVGNDASARPFERSSLAALDDWSPAAAPQGVQWSGSAAWGIPPGFDTQNFLATAKSNFVTLQAAWDRSDIAALRAMMTDGMLDEIRNQLAERESHSGAQPNTTDVVMINARLLGVEELPQEYLASIEFSGMIREEPSSGPNPFREVWNMSKNKSGNSGWLVAGVQALQ